MRTCVRRTITVELRRGARSRRKRLLVADVEAGWDPTVPVTLAWSRGRDRVRVGSSQLRQLLSGGARPDVKLVLQRDGQPVQVRDLTTGRISATLDTVERLANDTQHDALAARDRGCRFPGCDRSPRRCHAHHVLMWARVRRTRVRELVLLCPFHHGLITKGHWTLTLARDGTVTVTRGRARYRAPPPSALRAPADLADRIPLASDGPDNSRDPPDGSGGECSGSDPPRARPDGPLPFDHNHSNRRTSADGESSLETDGNPIPF